MSASEAERLCEELREIAAHSAALDTMADRKSAEAIHAALDRALEPGERYCPVHGPRNQDGYGHLGCNAIVRKEGGIPILCGRAVSTEPEELRCTTCRRSVADCECEEMGGEAGKFVPGSMLPPSDEEKG